MIKVENLTKRYAGFTAIQDLNFEVEKGEIVGFLGPNGAGKTTTMRILTGYLPASSGSASIAGFDVFEQSLEARRRIGYLPENTPLYHDMRVNEYLAYRSHLKGVPGGKVRERVGDVIALDRPSHNYRVGTPTIVALQVLHFHHGTFAARRFADCVDDLHIGDSVGEARQ